MTPEFSRRIALNEVGADRSIALSASEPERIALAKRLGVVRIDTLSAVAEISARAAGIEAHGIVSARVVQSCAASGAAVKATIEEPFEILFVVAAPVEGDEIELSADACDQIEHDGLAIDLGEAAAQTLALALDPFPRAAGAEVVLAKAGVVSEGNVVAGPFAALKGLK